MIDVYQKIGHILSELHVARVNTSEPGEKTNARKLTKERYKSGGKKMRAKGLGSGYRDSRVDREKVYVSPSKQAGPKGKLPK